MSCPGCHQRAANRTNPGAARASSRAVSKLAGPIQLTNPRWSGDRTSGTRSVACAHPEVRWACRCDRPPNSRYTAAPWEKVSLDQRIREPGPRRTQAGAAAPAGTAAARATPRERLGIWLPRRACPDNRSGYRRGPSRSRLDTGGPRRARSEAADTSAVSVRAGQPSRTPCRSARRTGHDQNRRNSSDSIPRSAS